MKLIASIILSTFLVGCAHNFMRGTVVMPINKKKAHVCLGDLSVDVGDRVMFFENTCTRIEGQPVAASLGETCDLTSMGTGKITRIINDHYSVVETDKELGFTKGTMIQLLD